MPRGWRRGWSPGTAPLFASYGSTTLNLFRMAMLTLTESAGLAITQDKASEFRNHFDQGKALFAAG